MAKRYSATVHLRCVKQHTCASCGSVYGYVLERRVAGFGSTEAEAEARMRRHCSRTQHVENDLQPCPNCGHYQPDMIGRRLRKPRLLLAWLAIIVMPILVPILRATYTVQANTLTWAVVAYCTVVLVAQYWLGRRDPNRDLEANKRLAAERVAAGEILYQPTAMGTNLLPIERLPKAGHSATTIGAMAVLVGAVLLAVGPEMLRATSGWPLNGPCYPPVAGPGDTTRIYMEDTLTCIKKLWRGRPEVTLQTEDGVVRHAEARSKQDDWAKSMTINSDEKSTRVRPWVEMTVPEDGALAGEDVTCDIKLALEWPEMSGPKTFANGGKEITRSVTIQLAALGAGATYNTAWWWCTLASVGAVFVGSVALVFGAKAYCQLARPATVAPAPA